MLVDPWGLSPDGGGDTPINTEATAQGGDKVVEVYGSIEASRDTKSSTSTPSSNFRTFSPGAYTGMEYVPVFSDRGRKLNDKIFRMGGKSEGVNSFERNGVTYTPYTDHDGKGIAYTISSSDQLGNLENQAVAFISPELAKSAFENPDIAEEVSDWIFLSTQGNYSNGSDFNYIPYAEADGFGKASEKIGESWENAVKNPQWYFEVAVATAHSLPTANGVPNGLSKTVSRQKQLRHLAGTAENAKNGGGFMNSLADAQSVLDAVHSGKATLLGTNKSGFPVYRVNGVVGTNVNAGAGIANQSTNVFIIKGTVSPSVVPTNPGWKP